MKAEDRALSAQVAHPQLRARRRQATIGSLCGFVARACRNDRLYTGVAPAPIRIAVGVEGGEHYAVRAGSLGLDSSRSHVSFGSGRNGVTGKRAGLVEPSA